jgi:Tol biopolymer transport system component
MRKTSCLVALGVVAFALAGCGSASGRPTTRPQATGSATSVPLALAAVGDGGRIAVPMRDGGGADIVAMNTDGTDTRRLTDDPAFDACPDFGPGGTLIAFCSNRSGTFEIWLMDGSGDNERRLTTLNGNSTFADISPDGRKVVFCGSPQGSTEEDHDIWLIDMDGNGLVQLTNSPGQDDCNPVWSPDGSKILFTGVRGAAAELWVMDDTGQEVRQVTTGQGAGTEPPDWSPDGKQLVYVAGGSLWVAPADRAGSRQLTWGPGTDSAPAWSPKGNEIVYRHQQDDGTWSLRIVSLETGQARALPTPEPGSPLAPAWQATRD